jgi:predicted house-cleaning noncanonical NTP pyrophosphatase (MazG superfamily)
MAITLKDFDEAHREFVEQTFPDVTDYRAPLEHMKEEVKEAIESGEPEEYADILMLLLSSFRLRFPELTTDDLLQFSVSKLIVNKQRKWGDVNEKGFREHLQ